MHKIYTTFIETASLQLSALTIYLSIYLYHGYIHTNIYTVYICQRHPLPDYSAIAR